MMALQASEPPFFSSEMNGRLRTGRTVPVKRAAGRLSPFTGLRSWGFARCIPPALDRLKRRYSQGTISPWKKRGLRCHGINLFICKNL